MEKDEIERTPAINILLDKMREIRAFAQNKLTQDNKENLKSNEQNNDKKNNMGKGLLAIAITMLTLVLLPIMPISLLLIAIVATLTVNVYKKYNEKKNDKNTKSEEKPDFNTKKKEITHLLSTIEKINSMNNFMEFDQLPTTTPNGELNIANPLIKNSIFKLTKSELSDENNEVMSNNQTLSFE